MKKLFAILLVVAMITAMATTVFADEELIDLKMAGILGHTYKIYQIYTGDITKEITNAETGAYQLVLSNLCYGSLYQGSLTHTVGAAVPDSEVKAFIQSQDPDHFKDLAMANNYYGIINENGDLTEETIKVAPGYYMIIDITAEDDSLDDHTKSRTILKIAEEITISSKHATISSEKKVKDVNDSDPLDTPAWKDSADHDIGDNVSFQLTVTLPETLEYYDSYTLTFHDKLSDGFTIPAHADFVSTFDVWVVGEDGTPKFEIHRLDVAANVDPDTITGNGYAVLNCPNSENGKCEYGGCSFTVRVGDVLKLYELEDDLEFAEGDKIVVTYSVPFNGNVKVGSAGNENSMYVCHPDGHTNQDTVTVLTYKLSLDKVIGGTTDRLAGAKFELQKYCQVDGVWGWYSVGEVTSTADGPMVWSGLDDGKYKLVETFTPAGYNTMEPIEGLIYAEHADPWLGGNSAFSKVYFRYSDRDAIIFYDEKDGVRDGVIEGTVENFYGTTLPETGAEGTFFLIAGGTLLIMIASVVMITRKKMSIYED